MQSLKYKKNIDGLRGISVLAVIIFHLNSEFLPGGFIGVDIFFVISGYLISKIILEKLENKEFKISEFFWSRVRRILPMLMFILVIFTPLIFYLLPSVMISISKSILSSLFFISNFFFYFESGYFGDAVNLKPYIHLWSLSVEEQFYIIFPLYCLLFYKKKYFILSITSFFLLSLFLSNFVSHNYPNANFFFTPTRAWEILFGVLLMFFEKRKFIISDHIINLLCSLSLVIIFFSFFHITNLDNIPNYKLIPPILATGILIIFGDKNNFIKKIICNKVIIFIGLISYSLYMLHQPILAFNKHFNFFEENLFTNIFFIICLIGLSTFTWKFIEKIFRDRNKISNKSFVYIITFFTLIILLINTIIIKSDGFIDNFKEEDKYLALLNPKIQGRYVSKKFNSLSKNKFGENKQKNIYVIGDSHSQDFINMVFENEYFEGYNVNTSPFNIECYLKFINKLSKNQKNKIRYCKHDVPSNLDQANSIFLVNVWEPWIVPEITKILNNEVFLDKKIYIIGTKNFGTININDLLKKSQLERKKLKFKLPKKYIELEKNLKNLSQDIIYISPYKSYCNENFECSIFNNNNKLISYDGGHLTKDGAKFIGKYLFDNNHLNDYKIFNKND